MVLPKEAKTKNVSISEKVPNPIQFRGSSGSATRPRRGSSVGGEEGRVCPFGPETRK